MMISFAGPNHLVIPSIEYWVKDGINYSDDLLNNLFSPNGGKDKAIRDGVLWSYVQTAKIYKCKSDTSPHLRSYSISAAMHGSIPQNLGRPYDSLSDISRSSDCMVFTDATTNSPWLDGAFMPLAPASDPNTSYLEFGPGFRPFDSPSKRLQCFIC